MSHDTIATLCEEILTEDATEEDINTLLSALTIGIATCLRFSADGSPTILQENTTLFSQALDNFLHATPFDNNKLH